MPAPMVPPIPMARPKASPSTRSSLPPPALGPAPRLTMTTPQLLEGPLHIDAGHLLAPRQIEIGVVHRLRGTERRLGCLVDGFRLETRADERGSRFGNLLGIARHPAQDDARFGDSLPVPPDPRRDAEHGKVERAATPQLVVDGIPPAVGRQTHRHQNLVRLLGEVVDTVVVIE